MKAESTRHTTLKQLKVGDFFSLQGNLFVKTQLWWDNCPGMDYGIIKFTEKRGKVVKQGLWLGSEAEILPAVFMDDVIARAIRENKGKSKVVSSKEGAK